MDYTKQLRELVSDWSALEIAALVEEYESLLALKELSLQADAARPNATTFHQDLFDLYEYKYCTDVDLLLQGTGFPAHRAILSARCPYFRDLLGKWPGYGAQVVVELSTAGIDLNIFSNLLRYLYTGDFCSTNSALANMDLLVQLDELGDHFGSPNPLEHDLRYLLETGDFADAILVFTSDLDSHSQSCRGSFAANVSATHSEYGFHYRLELPCHKAILSARSSFFRNLIQRKTRSGEELTERALHIPTKIVLDESVIPQRYARVLLQAIYLDTVDLGSILRDNQCTSQSSLGEAQSLVQGGNIQPTLIEEAMELYQIGRFQWVYRQALNYLREEFQLIAQSNIILELDKKHFVEVLSSDFLQATESEVLRAAIKWSEHQLIKKMEDRAHSLARKGVKRHDLNVGELRDILSEIIHRVRVRHIVPSSKEVLDSAIRRGIVSSPPSHMLGGDSERPQDAWVRCNSTGGTFLRPRLFVPYFEEVRSLLDDHLVHELELVRRCRLRTPHQVPDLTTYNSFHEQKKRGVISPSSSIDLINDSLQVTNLECFESMIDRYNELNSSITAKQAYSLPLLSRTELSFLMRLRVVREFGLPDQVQESLQNSMYCCIQNNFPEQEKHHHYDQIRHTKSGKMCSSVPELCKARASHGQRQPTKKSDCDVLRNNHSRNSCSRKRLTHGKPCTVYPDYMNRQQEKGSSVKDDGCSFSEGHLSLMMPDVALATTSMGQLHVTQPCQAEMNLHLGDGIRYQQQHVPVSAATLRQQAPSYGRPSGYQTL